MNVYDQIEAQHLIGEDYLDEIEIACPEEDARAAIETAAVALFDMFNETLVGELDSEPLLWGFVNLFHRHRTRIEEQHDAIAAAIKTMVAEFDGSEVADVEIQKAQKNAERTDERAITMSLLFAHAAEIYEDRIGKPWTPRNGSMRGNAKTAAMIDARDYLAAAKQREVEAKCPEGSPVVFAGGQDYQNHDEIWNALDRARNRVGDMVLVHGGTPRGAEHIASLWARERGVPQVVFRPDFKAHGKSAPFRRNDAMIALKPRAVIVFPGAGITLNVGQKAEEKKIPVWRPIREPVAA